MRKIERDRHTKMPNGIYTLCGDCPCLCDGGAGIVCGLKFDVQLGILSSLHFDYYSINCGLIEIVYLSKIKSPEKVELVG